MTTLDKVIFSLVHPFLSFFFTDHNNLGFIFSECVSLAQQQSNQCKQMISIKQ